ncbi:uncharacterized protein LOC129592941 [Paramacrobiotus metropolitanus]|uniref:uncharacterized protein LOC129592941 n=1 Tax=Paramacrobiotus metropolitanus TaxID=2943436 RepID=UPI0024456E5D|nr:uncharacterized protein LOC129592941 [Paramacrobiotus metropolitanus]
MAVLDPRTCGKSNYTNKGYVENEERITLHAIQGPPASDELEPIPEATEVTHMKTVKKLHLRSNGIPDENDALQPDDEEPAKNPGSATLAAKRVILGIMDVALLTSNAGQLRELLQVPYHPFRCFTFTLLMLSIVLQIAATGCFLLAYWWESEEDKTYKTLRKLAFLGGSFCIFVVLVSNIFIAVFLPMNGGYQFPPNVSASDSIC